LDELKIQTEKVAFDQGGKKKWENIAVS